MRVHALRLIVLLWPIPLAAQVGGPSGRWVIALGADVTRFSGGVRDTAATSETSVTLRPNGRPGIRVTLARDFGPWEAGLEVGWASGHAVGSNDIVSIEDRTSSFNRYRIAPSAGARVLRVGAGNVELAGGPTFDRWTSDGEDRWRIGGQARVALRLPLGPAEFENRLTFGVSGSPITRDDVGEDFESGSLRFLSFGAGVRLRL